MDESILISTACIEIGLAIGYGLNWLNDCRRMVYGFADALAGKAKA